MEDDEEVLRVIKKMKFSPGIQNGILVNVKMSQSVRFQLKKLTKNGIDYLFFSIRHINELNTCGLFKIPFFYLLKQLEKRI